MADRQNNDDSISKRLSSLIITRSPSTRGEIPQDNLAGQNADDRASGQVSAEPGDTGEAGQQG